MHIATAIYLNATPNFPCNPRPPAALALGKDGRPYTSQHLGAHVFLENKKHPFSCKPAVSSFKGVPQNMSGRLYGVLQHPQPVIPIID